MSSKEMISEYKLSHWAQEITQRAANGETIKAYCENRGISRNTYFYWQRKLRDAACEHIKGAQAEDSQGCLVSHGFAEVKVCEPNKQLLQMERPTAAWADGVTIEANGLRLCVGNNYPIDKLTQLLRELARI